jgi:hypothetical protein
LHLTGKVVTLAFPPRSVSMAISLGHVTRSGKKCSILHAATQAWQRVHFTKSMTIPHLILASP